MLRISFPPYHRNRATSISIAIVDANTVAPALGLIVNGAPYEWKEFVRERDCRTGQLCAGAPIGVESPDLSASPGMDGSCSQLASPFQ